MESLLSYDNGPYSLEVNITLKHTTEYCNIRRFIGFIIDSIDYYLSFKTNKKRIVRGVRIRLDGRRFRRESTPVDRHVGLSDGR